MSQFSLATEAVIYGAAIVTLVVLLLWMRDR